MKIFSGRRLLVNSSTHHSVIKHLERRRNAEYNYGKNWQSHEKRQGLIGHTVLGLYVSSAHADMRHSGMFMGIRFTRDRIVHFRMNEDEYDWLKTMSISTNVSMSDIILYALRSTYKSFGDYSTINKIEETLRGANDEEITYKV